MSAFIVKDETMGTIYSGLRVYGGSQLGAWAEVKRATVQLLDVTKDTHTLIDSYAGAIKQLYILNIRAVNQRYGDREEEYANSPKLKAITLFNPHVSPFQLLKSLECLRYQMSEGEVPQTDEYKALEGIINAIYRSIVRNSPSYELANWG